MADFIYHVTTEDEGREVREIMRDNFTFSARLRNRIKRNKLVRRNGEMTEGWHKVAAGDVIEIVLPEERSNFEPENIPLFPVYEDGDILLLNKQPGLVVHPTKGNPTGTVANALMYRMEETGEHFKVRFVNRLDRDTSGILIVAKNAFSQNEITKQMKADETEKRYVAIVEGIMEEDMGTIDAPIGRPDPDDVRRGVMEGGHPSVTHYKVIDRFIESGFTYVELRLETGRTHQIRVHMSHLGHPVLSDHLYGTERPAIIERQALHASSLSFHHPATGERLTITAPIPEDMKKALSLFR
ncbi:MAG: RluA family pseudouridine synthase [Firmicutes bacterium]|nr:RluA family pseudouridine synthase [Bacillota bacterium]